MPVGGVTSRHTLPQLFYLYGMLVWFHEHGSNVSEYGSEQTLHRSARE